MTETISLEKYREITGQARRNDASHPSPAASPKKRNKYNAQSVVVDGVRFASKAEAKRDRELTIMANAGLIEDLQRQPKFDLIVNGVKVCRYVGDWRYTARVFPTPNGRVVEHRFDVVEDRKGVLTPAFKLKWALAKALHPEIEWRLS